MHRTKYLSLPLSLLLIHCTDTIEIDPPNQKIEPTVLQPALENLGRSDVVAAHTTLDQVVLQNNAAGAEYGLSALTYLMTLNESCPSANLALSQMGVVLDVSHDIFGQNGFFGRASRDGYVAAKEWLSQQVESGSTGILFERRDFLYQEVEDAMIQFAPCADEAALRLQRAFDRDGVDLRVTLPGGLLFADAEVVFDAPELRLLQGSLELAAAAVRMVDAFELSFGPQELDASWFYAGMGTPDPVEKEMAAEQLQTVADELNTKYMKLKANGAMVLSAQRPAVKTALEHIQHGSQLAKDAQTQDGNGILHLARLDLVAMTTVADVIDAALDAMSGPTVVPGGDGTTWDFSVLFDARWQQPSYDAFLIDESEFGVWIGSVEAYHFALINQFFSARVITEMGIMGGAAEGSVLSYPATTEAAFERSTALWSPLQSYMDRNWEGAWTDLGRSIDSVLRDL